MRTLNPELLEQIEKSIYTGALIGGSWLAHTSWLSCVCLLYFITAFNDTQKSSKRCQYCLGVVKSRLK